MLERLFWRRVEKTSKCWYWLDGKSNGYGIVKFNGETIGAHRFVWIHILGRDAPEGMHVHHKCGNTACVNPEHLALLTPQQHIDQHRISRRAKRWLDKMGVKHFKPRDGRYQRDIERAEKFIAKMRR